MQQNGKIVAGGFTAVGPAVSFYDFMVARYTASGALDTTFDSGGNGYVTTDIAGNYDRTYAGIALDSAGRIILAGRSLVGSNYDFGVARYVGTPPNVPPVAQNTTATVRNGQSVSIPVTATDADGNTLTYQIVTQPQHGTISGTGPNYVYTPTPGYVGSDSFQFVANDGTVDSNTATVSITVTNTLPVAMSGSVAVQADISTPVHVVATDADGNTLTYQIVTQPQHGTITGTGPNYIYTPTFGYVGPDSFSFVANDGFGNSNIGTIAITVQGPSNITPGVSVGKGSFLGTGRYLPSPFRQGNKLVQTVTIQNTSGVAIRGPISLVLDNLQNATLNNRSGVAANGSPYIVLHVGSDNVFSAGEKVTVQLQFTSTNSRQITYNSRVTAGATP